MASIVIVGAGGHAASVLDCLMSRGMYDKIGILTDDKAGEWRGIPILGKIEAAPEFASEYKNAVVAIGDNHFRLKCMDYLERSGYHLPVLTHKTAYVSPGASVGVGTVILGGSIVNNHAALGRGCIVNTMSSVDHDCILKDGVHISPNAVLCGSVTVGKSTWIGAGSTVIDHIGIGNEVVVGAGSLVLRDIPDQVKAFGHPAEIISKVQAE